MNTINSISICILGHSGIGKSPLTKLFKVEGWEPFRVRKPRNDADAKVCKTKEEYDKLIKEHKNKSPLFKSSALSENDIKIYEDWSFFKVRNKPQCLEHTKLSKDRSVSLRIEIFAPVLLEIIQNLSKIKKAFYMDLKNLFFIFLNPTSIPFTKMNAPITELKLSTHSAIFERYRTQGKVVDLSDILKRIQFLDEELIAWQKIMRMSQKYIECMEWPHFEYRYSANNLTISDSKIELIQARYTIIKHIQNQLPDLLDSINKIMLTPDEIVQLDSII